MVATIVPLTIQVASIGIPDTLLLMLLALVVFGPRRLPEIGRQIGKLMYEFRKVSNDFKFQMEEELRLSEETARLEKLQTIAQPALPPASPANFDTPPQPLPQLTPVSSPVSEQSMGMGSSIAEPAESQESSAATEPAPEAEFEVRGEPRRFPHIQPPVSGETIAAQKPFRGRVPEMTEPQVESASEAATEAVPESIASSESATGQDAHHG